MYEVMRQSGWIIGKTTKEKGYVLGSNAGITDLPVSRFSN